MSHLIPDAFSRQTAPNWQDHSTGSQCQSFERKVGGPQALAEITGSRAHFRFTGPQIMKIAEKEPGNYANTSSVSLVSSFITSLLCGELTPLEEADSCGMNLYDIRKRQFNEDLLSLIDSNEDNIRTKLMDPPLKCDKPVRLGSISKYFVQKYGFNPSCSIFPLTGDNLATICSLPLKTNDAVSYTHLDVYKRQALGGANENVLSLIILFIPEYLPLWLLSWIIMNISPTFNPMVLDNVFYRYGYMMPLHQALDIFKVVFLNVSKRHMGRNYGILVAWIVVNTCLFPLVMKIVGKTVQKRMEAKKN